MQEADTAINTSVPSMPAGVAEGLVKLTWALTKRYDKLNFEKVWQSPPKFDGSREWRATIYINSVITHWRYSNSRRKWLRSN